MGIFDFFKRKSTKETVRKDETLEDTILVNIDEITPKISVILGPEYFGKIERAILNGETTFRFSANVWQNALKVAQEQISEDMHLSKTADLNTQGIKFEKEGDIAGAIKLYEENIAMKYPATHAYERLMILYHKAKDYEKEARVIGLAIDVFTEENKRRYEHAVKSHPDMKDLIEDGFNKCKLVCNADNWVVFNPYDIPKYRKRLEKLRLKNLII